MAESGLSENVFYAAIVGDIDFIKNWHAQGGDPDQGLDREFDDGVIYEQGTTLLMVAAYRGRLDVVRLLVEAGADVNVRLPDDGRSALAFAISRCHADCVEFLLARGAKSSGIVDGTRIICNPPKLLECPRIVRMLSASGFVLTTARFYRPHRHADNGRTLEEIALHHAASHRDHITLNRINIQNYRGRLPDLIKLYTESAEILEGVRLAGHSYKRWVLKDYMALLRVRSLLARGPRRARAGPETLEVAKRLFDGVPDPCFWKVVDHAWLGNWRRP